MSLIPLLVALLIIGAVLYIVSIMPIDATVKRIIQVVAIVAVCIWVLEQLTPGLRI